MSLQASCLALWSAAFGEPFDEMRAVLAGGTLAHTRDVLYVARVGPHGALAGTAVLTMGRGPGARFGGVGEVATAPAFRKRGVVSHAASRATPPL